MNKVSKILIGIVSVLFIVIFILVFSLAELKKNSTNKYDLSNMHEVSVEDIESMFSSKKTYVLFIGRKDCIVCEHILPTLYEAQINNNYITQYLDISIPDRNSEKWKNLANKFTMLSTQTLDEKEEGKKVTETYGYFLTNYGFTPTIIVIKDGKQTAGFIGNADKKELLEWIKTKIN